MFGTANRRGPSAPLTPAALEVADANRETSREAPRAPERQPLQRADNHPGPMAARPAPASSPSPAPATMSAASLPDEGRLTVGRDIRLTGELKSCESLLVEGVVNLDLQGTKFLEVMEGGTFAGSAMVETAEIAGSFEGDLTVTSLLIIHPSGRINGNITTSELQLERGGMICGNLQMTGKGSERPSRIASTFSRRDADAAD